MKETMTMDKHAYMARTAGAMLGGSLAMAFARSDPQIAGMFRDWLRRTHAEIPPGEYDSEQAMHSTDLFLAMLAGRVMEAVGTGEFDDLLPEPGSGTYTDNGVRHV
jgi:hypothetical protein